MTTGPLKVGRGVQFDDGTDLAVAPTGQARIRYNPAFNRLEVSIDGSLWAPLGTGGGGGSLPGGPDGYFLKLIAGSPDWAQIIIADVSGLQTELNDLNTQIAAIPALRWYDVTRPPYNAVGDGTVDDGPAFQLAFNDALAAKGGTVYVPKGNYRIATNIAISGVDATPPVIHFVGDGSNSKLIPDMSGIVYGFNFNAVEVIVDKLLINSQSIGSGFAIGGGGVNVAQSVLIASFHAAIKMRDVIFDFVTAPDGIVTCFAGRMELWNVYVSDRVYTNTTLGSAYFSCRSIDPYGWKGFLARNSVLSNSGNIFPHTGHALYFTDPIMLDQSFTGQDGIVIDNCSFGDIATYDTIHLEPSVGKVYKSLDIRDTSFGVCDHPDRPEPNRGAGNLMAKQANQVKIERCWNGFGGVETYRSAYTFVNCGEIRCEQVFVDGDHAFRAPVQGALFIQADAACDQLTIVDSNFYAIESACPTMVEQDGVRAKLRKATLVPSATLVKPDPANAGQVIPLGASDSASLRCGVAIDGSAKATGTVTFNNAFNITEGDSFPLFDGVNVAKTVFFTLAAGGSPGQVIVTVSNSMTSAQRAIALRDAINAEHGLGFRFTATASGAVCTITNDTEGIIGNRPITYDWGDVPDGDIGDVAGAIVINGMTGGRSYTRVAGPGEEVEIKSDGTTTVAPGDLIEKSTTLAGRARAGSTNPIGVAVSAASATVDALIRVILNGEATSAASLLISQSQVTGLAAALTSRADDSTVVHLAGTETITGVKTINSPIISSPSLSGTATGTYTLGGTPTLNADLSGAAGADVLLAGDGLMRCGRLSVTGDVTANSIVSNVANGGGAVAHVLDTANAYSTNGAKLLSLRTNGVEFGSIARANSTWQVSAGTSGDFSGQHYITAGSSPTVATNLAGWSTPTNGTWSIVAGSTDESGRVRLVGGTGLTGVIWFAADGNVFTVTLNRSYPNGFEVMISPANNAAGTLFDQSTIFQGWSWYSTSTNAWVLHTSRVGSGLVNGVTYEWSYTVRGR